MVLDFLIKMLLANDIAEFLNQLSVIYNQLDFWHDDIDSTNLKGGL